MEGERRKRKLERGGGEEENEEEKMEKFFALIKSTKDARDQLFNKDAKKVNEEDLKKEKGMIWTPMFQPEDFIDCGELRKSNVSGSTTTLHAGPSGEEQKEKEKAKEKEVMQIEKEYLPQEAITPAVVAPTLQNHEPREKEKAIDPLDLNLSL